MSDPIAVPVGRLQQLIKQWRERGKTYRQYKEAWRNYDFLAAANLHADELESALSAALAPPPVEEWRCFHCDEVFTDKAEAREHFGSNDWKTPACRLSAADVRRLRELEAANAALRRENELLDNDARLWHESEADRVRRIGHTQWWQEMDSREGERLALVERIAQLEAALAPPAGPAGKHEYSPDQLCSRCGVVEPCAVHEGFPEMAAQPAGTTEKDQLKSDLCLCGHSRAAHVYYQAGGIFTACRSCTCEAYEPSRVTPVGPTGKDYPHRCSGCGLRWQTTEPGSVAAELCGDCWRKVQPILHTSPPAGVQEQGWQPIATVPDDAAFIIAVWPVNHSDVFDVGEAWRDSPGTPWISAYESYKVQPTHWMPLPDPPSAASVPQEPKR